MNLQQTSCLLLLKVLNCLGKLNGGGVVAALIFDSLALFVAGFSVPEGKMLFWLCCLRLARLSSS